MGMRLPLPRDELQDYVAEQLEYYYPDKTE